MRLPIAVRLLFFPQRSARKGRGTNPALCDLKPHSSGRWNSAELSLVFRGKTQNILNTFIITFIITFHFTFYVDHISHHVKDMLPSYGNLCTAFAVSGLGRRRTQGRGTKNVAECFLLARPAEASQRLRCWTASSKIWLAVQRPPPLKWIRQHWVLLQKMG